VLAVLGLSLLVCGSAWAQADFSADIVSLSAASNTFHTRIFSTKDKLRFQQEVKSGRVDSIMIANLAKQTSIVLLPQQKQYIESSRPQIPGQGVTFFQARDVEDACGEWQKVMQMQLVADDDDEKNKTPAKEPSVTASKSTCRKIGHEIINGRDTVKYADTPDKGDSSAIWLDGKLHFPVRWKNAVGAGELRNIKEEPQAAELFAIPSGYTKRVLQNPPEKNTSKP
jgi:hypothetical protein